MWTDAMVLGMDVLAAATETGGKAPLRPMDEGRFEAFYRKTAGGLWAYLYRLTNDPAASDDLLQKTFYRFLRARPMLASDDHMRRWLYRTATNLVMDHFRETKRRGTVPLEDGGSRAAATTGADLRHDMLRVFGELKPQERALLWLAHVEESDHAEIAEALGLKPKSVRVLLFRARKRLGEMLRKRGLGPGEAR